MPTGRGGPGLVGIVELGLLYDAEVEDDTVRSPTASRRSVGPAQSSSRSRRPSSRCPVSAQSRPS